MNQRYQSYIAEFLGTFFLLFIGTGSVIVNSISQNALGHVGVAFSFGIVILIMIYACGHISGAHFNCAVTITFAAMGKFPKNQVLPYIISQICGAVAACALLQLLFPNTLGLGCTLPAPFLGNHPELTSFIFEFIFTFCLMFVITAVATDSRAQGSFAGMAIGFTVFVGALVAGPICGGSFNPARSLAPAMIAGQYQHLWLYIVGPTLGALTAGFTYNLVRETSRIHSKPVVMESKTGVGM